MQITYQAQYLEQPAVYWSLQTVESCIHFRELCLNSSTHVLNWILIVPYVIFEVF